METTIMALTIEPRSSQAPEVQNILTEYGCIIKTRLGLHEVTEDACSEHGLVLLHIRADMNKVSSLEKDLSKIDGVKVKYMTL